MIAPKIVVLTSEPQRSVTEALVKKVAQNGLSVAASFAGWMPVRFAR